MRRSAARDAGNTVTPPSRTFASLDNHLWALSCKWATFRHASKPKKWIVARSSQLITTLSAKLS